ncbi:cellulose synthase/poly-beta-1,6-N-acetylglucosamine synthase-like glycosyltransferase [Mucilaginibacter gracilis]|uniref:Cellulose synthase/poly-beta-1,6-N-acetylglucosamine synthase-like glycosyltransferase n=1 Tax=Mucilaginibacter gracilis TaxID=423350 RepID=A0A495JA01_9SPHI|nr:glycosyltransferase family 2 protein [Mucilaginibacter gracilis]RKR85747.1 cellulose synthase/poly-beta-1,6-N-acetylglucosamine synthase-like glycosyltransferase [Mucilaginibacter gracilis]
MKRVEPVKPPSKRELFTLRLMIVLGLAAMFFFLRGLLNPNIVGFTPLYWMLLVSIFFICLKVLHEWIHYFCITLPETPPQQKLYTVDVFTTFCAGEPYDMIVETLTAMQAITYPHTTYLCDEANDPYLKELCEKLHINHVTRIQKIDAKAGNINNALKYASGEICVILDPDHVPFPDFLDRIIPHFNNTEIGFVQIVQAYRNHNQGLIAKGAAQQTFQFYGPIMMTMNKYGTVLAIGANCTFRRTALDSIGGHAAGLAEDMHTAMQLHAKGWKSVYVPAVLARGLVPATLSAYYAQQLKWSRGVFELFVTAYPKLFKKFTWQQKLHYGVIPLHYLSGVIFLLNFLIPVISLTFDIDPLTLDLSRFAIIGLPLAIAVILIRHFVQWWVMEDDERGFHIVGGLLMIGTWWIFMIGLFYTILRKKVPYNPTPKDGNEEDSWRLNIPNIAVIGVSIAAIIYGLYNDWSPYTLIMAGFAMMNCFIVLFSIIASRQFRFRKLKERNDLLYRTMSYVTSFKKQFWKLRRRIYAGVRSTALLITVFTLCVIFYFVRSGFAVQVGNTQNIYTKNIFLTGIFDPQGTDGLTSVKMVKQYERKAGRPFNIVSFYLSWGDEPRCEIPLRLLDSVYRIGAIPMLTWEPWQSLFAQTKNFKDSTEKKVFVRINSGRYDGYLSRFASQVKALRRPVYIRFAHEADNPFYPWSERGGNTPRQFVSAWRYVHDYFKRHGANNVIWVWNPWKAKAVSTYFPGTDYVDWIGVDVLNYGPQNNDGKWYSMAQLYYPFHNNPVFKSGLPVMLAEMGSLSSAGRQSEWLNGAFTSIPANFPEIKAVVLFNTAVDKNIVGSNSAKPYNWQVSDWNSLSIKLSHLVGKDQTAQYPGMSTLIVDQILPKPIRLTDKTTFNLCRGVNYTKG